MTERIPCVVPFCRRTMKPDGHSTEHICGKHWRHADRGLRQRYNKLRRWAEPLLEAEPETYSPAARAEIIATVGELYQMWGQIKRQAIEGAMGIG
jgi:hypothetical protein